MRQWVLWIVAMAILFGCQTAPLPPPVELVRPVDGFEAYEMGDYQTAYRELMPLAEAGDARAQAKVGQMYWLGLGIEEDDVRAAAWLQESARQGEPEARMPLAMLYMLGSGVDQDDAEAAALLRPLAEQGLAEAQFYLGLMYMNGRGVEEDLVEACKWLQLAAGQGHRKADQLRVELVRGMSPEQISQVQGRVDQWRPTVPVPGN